ncbi:hypothetical protein BN000_04505 [Neobacillus massiliamazoniensis]|uniref:Uncharacterized protein n=1 Tax=Neobacillus massiliamazoniensis TaxID=1499688 RepID=A0A0U1P2K8_9BACI|nr:hypothetical protein BN000_04505 [Neobacillus massiliamazoniensis]
MLLLFLLSEIGHEQKLCARKLVLTGLLARKAIEAVKPVKLTGLNYKKETRKTVKFNYLPIP